MGNQVWAGRGLGWVRGLLVCINESHVTSPVVSVCAYACVCVYVCVFGAAPECAIPPALVRSAPRPGHSFWSYPIPHTWSLLLVTPCHVLPSHPPATPVAECPIRHVLCGDGVARVGECVARLPHAAAKHLITALTPTSLRVMGGGG